MKKGDTVFYVSTVSKKQFTQKVTITKEPYKLGDFMYADVQFENVAKPSKVLLSNLQSNETN